MDYYKYMNVLDVLIPVYNDAVNLRKSLSCLLNQTFSNFRVILIDDGSEDNSYKVAEEFSPRFKHMEIYKNERNIGVIPTLIEGQKYLKSKYLYYCSSNDFVVPDFFENSLTLLDQYPDMPLCASDVIGKFSSGERRLQCLKNNNKNVFYPSALKDNAIYKHLNFFGQGVILKTEFILDLQPWKKELYGFSDLFIFFLLASNFGCLLTHKIGAQVNMKNGFSHNQSVSKRKESFAFLVNLLKNYGELSNALIESGLLGKLGPRFLLEIIQTKHGRKLLNCRLLYRIYEEKKHFIYQ